jgi:hypothetical protein
MSSPNFSKPVDTRGRAMPKVRALVEFLSAKLADAPWAAL